MHKEVEHGIQFSFSINRHGGLGKLPRETVDKRRQLSVDIMKVKSSERGGRMLIDF